ncbi:hypothetical protein Hanom_Chr00s196510g01836651 [Helianthus anomalus]
MPMPIFIDLLLKPSGEELMNWPHRYILSKYAQILTRNDLQVFVFIFYVSLGFKGNSTIWLFTKVSIGVIKNWMTQI